MIYRIIDKQTNLFIRDDFECIEETEIALEVEPSQGLYLPKWSGTEWIEGMAQEEIDLLKNVVVEQPLELRNRADIDYLSIMTGVDL